MKHVPNISYTVRNDLCTGCGVCQDACPSHAISIQVEKGCFRPVVDESLCKNRTGCHRCYDSCPGVGVNLKDMAKQAFPDEGMQYDKYVGSFLKCFTGHSNTHEIRFHSASGGMVSQMLVWLLEKHYIDGAFVTSFDKDAPLLVRSYLATTPEDILVARSSKYSPVTLDRAISEIKKAPGSNYIIVGLPCHIEGFRKYEQLDRRFKEKIAAYFAIYCSSGRSFYLTEHVFRARHIDPSKLTYFAYRDKGCLGKMVAKGEGIDHEERFQDFYQPLRSFFVPRRCCLCIDHYGELGDVCFGDIHIDPYIADTIGVNSLVVRNKKCLDWLTQAKAEGVITLDEIPVSLMNKGQVMARVKKGRNAAFIRFDRMLGRKVPAYDYLPREGKTGKWLVSYLHTGAQRFIGSHKWMWWAIKIFKGKGAKR